MSTGSSRSWCRESPSELGPSSHADVDVALRYCEGQPRGLATSDKCPKQLIVVVPRPRSPSLASHSDISYIWRSSIPTRIRPLSSFVRS